MALDKIVDSAKLNSGLTAIADAIREKTGKAEKLLFPDGFVDAIMAITAKTETPKITFSSPSPFTIATFNGKKNWDGALYYSTDAAVWVEWDGVSTISSGEDNVLHVCGANNTIITNTATSADASAHWLLTGENIRCDGNIECLLDYKTVARGEHPVMANFCFNRMFYGNTGLVKGPDLPATELAPSCYRSMFNRCTSLVETPVLPATELKSYCYYFMFYECTSLRELVALPATKLAVYCYGSMYRNCTGIKLSAEQTGEYVNEYRIPFGGDGTSASYALDYMFTATGGTFKGAPTINTVYYTANEIVGAEEKTRLLSADGYVLTDKDGNYLITKEDE